MALVSANTLRKRFFKQLSEMYAKEVPLYDKLLETVKDINQLVASQHPEWGLTDEQLRNLSSERHGAIRLGKPSELKMMARFFNQLGMQPVNFYNLADAGAKSQPVISTAFRPLKHADHRIFCSLLMTDYFEDEIRKRIEDALEAREIFSETLVALIEIGESQGGFDEKQAQQFIEEGQTLFGWRGQATDYQLYQDLVAKKVNIAADVACFPNPHLNHLTPNSLDIERLYQEMKQRLGDQYKMYDHKGMKDSIEGPPSSPALVFLRQTSYKALTEKVIFKNPVDGSETQATHTARFGEIEQRGVAMTQKGRKLYDEAIKKAEAIDAQLAVKDYDAYMQAYADCFTEIPRTHTELRNRQLAFYRYEVTDKGYETIHAKESVPGDIESCIAAELIHYVPIRYEDFLPVSAAGIFASNLNQYGTESENANHRQYHKSITGRDHG
ncbi:MAG: DUF1338 family protein [Alphaproteobacteria bacterium]|nr:DUF1338 family protein [Alphaproteobacteria bacterium]